MLLICLIGGVIFGSLGNFFGLISGLTGDVASISNGNYVYSGGNVSELIEQGNNNHAFINPQDTASYKESVHSISEDGALESQDSEVASNQSSDGGSQGSGVVSSSSSDGGSQGSGVVSSSSSDGGSQEVSSNPSGSQSSISVNSSSDVGSVTNYSEEIIYGDWQKDQETGMLDVEGNPIYVSIVSSSGGQMDPGIYEVYWSELGPINQTRIG